MLVSQILGSKDDASVIEVDRDEPVSVAAKILSEKRIGALLVPARGSHAAGILSERDIVRELGRVGSGCLSRPVAELMSQTLYTCCENETANDVLQRMTQGRFRHLPVMTEGRIVGMISIGDVVKARLAELAMEKEALEGMIMGF